MSAEGGGAVCACARPGVINRIGNRSLNDRRSRTRKASALSLRSLRIVGEKEVLDDVEPPLERQPRGDVSLAGKSFTMSRTTDQTNLSRELETSTALPTRRTPNLHAKCNREALHYTSYSHCIQSAASILQLLRPGSTLRTILGDRGNFGTSEMPNQSTGSGASRHCHPWNSKGSIASKCSLDQARDTLVLDARTSDADFARAFAIFCLGALAKAPLILGLPCSGSAWPSAVPSSPIGPTSFVAGSAQLYSAPLCS